MKTTDKPKFTELLTTTIQAVAGTMRPPATLLAAYYKALQDLELEDLTRVLEQWQRNSNTWPSPAGIRTAIEGRPDQDTFDDYFDHFVSTGRTAEYKHPVGLQVIAAMGGSGTFRQMNIRDRPEWKQRWVKAYRKIQNAGTEISAKPE